MSIDGNFALVRKTTAGQSHGKPKHGDLLFLPDSEVKSFVDSYNTTEKPINSVSTVNYNANMSTLILQVLALMLIEQR